MKNQSTLTIAALLMASLLVLTACGGENTPKETETSDGTPESATETTMVPETAVETEPMTQDETVPETIPATGTETILETESETVLEEDGNEEETDRLYREDWDDNDPNNPYLNLIEVGKSYDGITTCYDGRYDFGRPVCKTEDGTEFSSVQDAIDYLEFQGGSINMLDDLNICLQLYIPEDYCFYRIFYDYKNVDFVFNHGVIYDDNTLNEAAGVRGFAYYSNFDILDMDTAGIFDGTYIWIVAEYDDFLEPGRYIMRFESEFIDEEWPFFYYYEYVCDMNLWDGGLPKGEELP